MRFSTSISLLLATLAIPLVVGEPIPAPEGPAPTVAPASAATPPAKVESEVKAPDIVELTTGNFWGTIAKGYW